MVESGYPRKGSIFDLEQAIKMHIEGERKWIQPLNNPTTNNSMELHIQTIEKAPRDSKSLEQVIARKKKVKDQAVDIILTQKLYTEIEALERLLGMVQLYESGQPLDGVAY